MCLVESKTLYLGINFLASESSCRVISITNCCQVSWISSDNDKNSKIWDTSNNCHNCPKIGKVWCNIALMHPKEADAMANSVDPDQTASSEAVWSWSALFAETFLSQYIEFLRYDNAQDSKREHSMEFLYCFFVTFCHKKRREVIALSLSWSPWEIEYNILLPLCYGVILCNFEVWAILTLALRMAKTLLSAVGLTLTVSWIIVALLFYVHGKHLRSCRDGQLT